MARRPARFALEIGRATPPAPRSAFVFRFRYPVTISEARLAAKARP